MIHQRKFGLIVQKLFKCNHTQKLNYHIIDKLNVSNRIHNSYNIHNIRKFSVITDKLESLGDSITTAVLLSWSKEPGDPVKEDDVIAIVETDKVTMDIRSKKSGVFIEGLVAAGSEVAVGADLYRIDTKAIEYPINSEAVNQITSPPKPVDNKVIENNVQNIDIAVPSMGDSITQGVLVQWLVKSGEGVSVDQVVAMIETDKVTVEVRSPHSGTVIETFASEGDEVIVGNPLFVISPGANTSTNTPTKQPTIDKPANEQIVSAPIKIEPEKKQEVVKPSTPPPQPTTAVSKEKATSNSSTTNSNDRSETRVKMTRMRLRIAQRLKESQNTAAMLTTFQEVDMSTLIKLRNTHKDEFEKFHGVKLGFMSAFVKAATATLKELPAINAVIDDSTNEIIYRNYIDISVAVASPNGLVVPVLRNTEKMSFADVEKSINHYGKKAKDGALALEDMTGGTFTISNGGVFGSLFGTPIINPPQSAILGMHATKIRPVVVDGKVEARPMMYLALTYDHRLIDGREAVTFLKGIQAKIEDPTRLLLDI